MSYPVGLVGESHYQRAIAKLSVGDPVYLYRQPSNPYDSYAIVATNSSGQVIGYIPKQNFVQGVVWNEGRGITARVFKINKNGMFGKKGIVITAEIREARLLELKYTRQMPGCGKYLIGLAALMIIASLL